jgi:2-keto-4-pentenoate hydratase/2-oxohepta-3-ene-1,7-dioic acid hydratase in catechol pathway
MKWMSYEHQGAEGFGHLVNGQADGQVDSQVDGQVQPYAGTLFQPLGPIGDPIPLSALTWRPPCRPGKIIGLWNNFRAAADKNGWAVPAEPLYFLKSPGAAAAHGQPIPVPGAYEGRVAYEGELVVVIGHRAAAVTVAQAADHILGYTCGNDLTALELLNRDPSFAQWTRAKSFDGFAAFGPVIDTDFDPSAASLRTLVGGRERQNYPLADMFFAPHELVSRLSHDMTLEPGDLIYCGTSLGVLPMKPGSTVEVVIDGIGTLSNTYG